MVFKNRFGNVVLLFFSLMGLTVSITLCIYVTHHWQKPNIEYELYKTKVNLNMTIMYDLVYIWDTYRSIYIIYVFCLHLCVYFNHFLV